METASANPGTPADVIREIIDARHQAQIHRKCAADREADANDLAQRLRPLLMRAGRAPITVRGGKAYAPRIVTIRLEDPGDGASPVRLDIHDVPELPRWADTLAWPADPGPPRPPAEAATAIDPEEDIA